MRISSNLVAFAMSAGLVAGVSVAGSAEAATSARVFAQNPATICQSALPTFDGVIRKRPKALQNEGETTSFVTCSWTSQGGDGPNTTDVRNPTRVQIYFVNNAGGTLAVNCTGVLGYAGQAIPSVVKTVNVTSANSAASIQFLPADFAAGATVLQSSLVSVSCSLPPGAGIVDSYLYFSEDIGAPAA